MEKGLICIGCPLGCEISVELLDNEIVKISGNTCPRGERYAREEITAPTRIVTTTVRVKNGHLPVVSVKTKSDIPKQKIMECIRALQGVSIEAPVKINQIVMTDVVGTGVDIIATKNVKITDAK